MLIIGFWQYLVINLLKTYATYEDKYCYLWVTVAKLCHTYGQGM